MMQLDDLGGLEKARSLRGESRALVVIYRSKDTV